MALFQSRKRKAFNYVSIILLLGLIALGWSAYAFVPAYYSKAQMDEAIQTAFFTHWAAGPDRIKEDILAALKQNERMIFDEEKIEVTKKEGTTIFRAVVPYRYRVAIPFRKDELLIDLEVITEKDLSLQKTLSF